MRVLEVRRTKSYSRTYVIADERGDPTRRRYQPGEFVWLKYTQQAAEVCSHDHDYVIPSAHGNPLEDPWVIDPYYTVRLIGTDKFLRRIRAGSLELMTPSERAEYEKIEAAACPGCDPSNDYYCKHYKETCHWIDSSNRPFTLGFVCI